MPPQDAIAPEFLAMYDAERAAMLRRRAVWYSITILALVAMSWAMTLYEVIDGTAFTGGESASAADILTDSLFTLLYGGALVYFARGVRSRAEIVRTFQWVVAVSGITAVAVTPLLMNTTWVPGASLDHTPETDLAQAFASLMTVFLLHFLASVFVALSPREGLLPLVPVLIAFAAWVVFVSVGSAAQRVGLILGAPLAGLPGVAWGWWRYRSFSDRFHARAIRQRYAEVTQELSDARRVHEALFPPPVSRGPVRVRYTYEPMRAIGGDFLFIRPLAFPPSATVGPTLVVLIDVTGHGIAAALAVNRLHAELDRLTAADPLPSPAAVITGLNAFTCAALAPQSMFATAFCLRITPATELAAASITWAGAGHPPAYLRTHAVDGQPVRLLESTAPMLGVIDADLFTCDEGELPIAPGDAIVALTDGAIEAMDSRSDQFGIEGVRAAIAAAEPGTPLPDAITAAVDAHSDGPARDDMLIVEISLQ